MQCRGGAHDTFIYLCVTTPSAGHASVDEILLLLPTFLISDFLSSAVTCYERVTVRSSVTHHLCKFRSFSLALLLSVQTFTSLLYCSIGSGCTPAVRPPPLLIVELREAVPAQQRVWLLLFFYSFFHFLLISLFFS